MTVKFNPYTKIEQSGSHMVFKDQSNPAGWTLTQLAASGTAGGGGASGWLGYTWNDGIGRANSTGSVAIDSQGRYANQLGVDNYFWVSGTIGQSGALARLSVFGGDLIASGAIVAGAVPGFTGSLTKTVGGLSYIVGVGGVAVTSNSLGQVIVSGSVGGGGGTTTINNTYVLSGVAAQGQAAYHGFTSASMFWMSASAAFVPIQTALFQGSLTTTISSNVLQSGSTWTFLNGGLYWLHSDFNAYGNDAYVTLRWRGSNGGTLSRTTYRTTPADQSPVSLNGVFSASIGEVWTLEYITSGTVYPWTGSNPLPTGGNMTTGEVGFFLLPTNAGTGGPPKAPIYSMPILAGVVTTNTAYPANKQSLGVAYFDPTTIQGFGGTSRNYFFRAVIDCITFETNLSASVDLYDINGIVSYPPGVIVGSIMSSSSPGPVQLQVNLTSLLQVVSGSGLFEARLWRTVNGSALSIVNCRNARLDVEYS